MAYQILLNLRADVDSILTHVLRADKKGWTHLGAADVFSTDSWPEVEQLYAEFIRPNSPHRELLKQGLDPRTSGQVLIASFSRHGRVLEFLTKTLVRV